MILPTATVLSVGTTSSFENQNHLTTEVVFGFTYQEIYLGFVIFLIAMFLKNCFSNGDRQRRPTDRSRRPTDRTRYESDSDNELFLVDKNGRFVGPANSRGEENE